MSRAIDDDDTQPFSPRGASLSSHAIAVFTVHPYEGGGATSAHAPESPTHEATTARERSDSVVVCGICLESAHSPPTKIPQALLNTPQPLPRPCGARCPTARRVAHTFNPFITLPCNHVFHLQCIRKHIFHRGAEATCPQCRGEMPHYVLYRRRPTAHQLRGDEDNDDARVSTPSTHRPLTRFDVVCRNVIALGVIIMTIVVVSTHVMRTEYTNG